MLKRLVQLVVVAAVLYAGWNAGWAYARYYQFKDGISETARFSQRSTEEQLRQRVLELAARLDVPLDPEALTIQIDPDFTRIRAPYTEHVKLLPNYIYEWKFEPAVDSWRAQ